jgi:hypothetical protein
MKWSDGKKKGWKLLKKIIQYMIHWEMKKGIPGY